MSQKMLALSMSKENQKLKKKNEEIEVENSNLKRIKSLFQHENEKAEEMDRRNEEVRWYTKMLLFCKWRNGDSKPWEDEALGKKGKWSLPCCRFTKPPHSSTAMQYRHRWMLRWVCEGSSTVKSNSPGSMAPVQGMRSLKKEWPVFIMVAELA